MPLISETDKRPTPYPDEIVEPDWDYENESQSMDLQTVLKKYWPVLVIIIAVALALSAFWRDNKDAVPALLSSTSPSACEVATTQVQSRVTQTDAANNVYCSVSMNDGTTTSFAGACEASSTFQIGSEVSHCK